MSDEPKKTDGRNGGGWKGPPGSCFKGGKRNVPNKALKACRAILEGKIVKGQKGLDPCQQMYLDLRLNKPEKFMDEFRKLESDHASRAIYWEQKRKEAGLIGQTAAQAAPVKDPVTDKVLGMIGQLLDEIGVKS